MHIFSALYSTIIRNSNNIKIATAMLGTAVVTLRNAIITNTSDNNSNTNKDNVNHNKSNRTNSSIMAEVVAAVLVEEGGGQGVSVEMLPDSHQSGQQNLLGEEEAQHQQTEPSVWATDNSNPNVGGGGGQQRHHQQPQQQQPQQQQQQQRHHSSHGHGQQQQQQQVQHLFCISDINTAYSIALT